MDRLWEGLGKFGEDLARVLKGLRASWALLKVSGLLGGVVGRFGKDFGRVSRRLKASLALLRDSGLLFVISLCIQSLLIVLCCVRLIFVVFACLEGERSELHERSDH